jgi:tryptophanyl-tRNA synthetase
MRDIAERFNERYGETLVVPRHRIHEIGGRVMDLQAPDVKMSTTLGTEQGTLYIGDSEEAMTTKVMRAVTDSGSDVVRGPGKPGISNLIEVMAVLRDTTPEDVERGFSDARYGDFKKAVAATGTERLGPIRERYRELKGDRDALEDVLAQGARKAQAIAADTLVDVREKMGVGPPG